MSIARRLYKQVYEGRSTGQSLLGGLFGRGVRFSCFFSFMLQYYDYARIAIESIILLDILESSGPLSIDPRVGLIDNKGASVM